MSCLATPRKSLYCAACTRNNRLAKTKIPDSQRVRDLSYIYSKKICKLLIMHCVVVEQVEASCQEFGFDLVDLGLVAGFQLQLQVAARATP